ncbi:hypothetical protein D3C81_1487150 [compost metagenome]
MGGAPGQLARQGGAVDGQQGAVAQGHGLVQARQARGNGMAAGCAAGLHAHLGALGIAQEQFSGEQVVGQAGLVATTEQQLAGQ